MQEFLYIVSSNEPETIKVIRETDKYYFIKRSWGEERIRKDHHPYFYLTAVDALKAGIAWIVDEIQTKEEWIAARKDSLEKMRAALATIEDSPTATEFQQTR